MNNSEGDDTSQDSDINLPPIKLPNPDPFDTSKSNEGKSSFLKKGRKKKKKKGRHPLDRYKDVRKEKKGLGGCGGCGCFVLVLVLLVAGGIGYSGYALSKNYTILRVEGMEGVISTAPDKATCYIGLGNITYNVPQTTVPVMILGQKIKISGEFSDKLSIRGTQVTCQSGAHCRGDFDVYAIEYIDEGIRVDGQKSGKMLQ